MLLLYRILQTGHGLKVVYDAAHAFGVEIDGVTIGTYGDISMFSFHATKLFHTAEGGALTFKDKNLKSRIDLLKILGLKNEEEVVMPGINGKMNEIQAAIGLIMLGYVEEERNRRKILLETYRKCLKGVEGISICNDNSDDVSGFKPSYQYLVIRIDENALGNLGIMSMRNLKSTMYLPENTFIPLAVIIHATVNYPHHQPIYR